LLNFVFFDRERGHFSILDAAMNDLAQLINRLDLEVTLGITQMGVRNP